MTLLLKAHRFPYTALVLTFGLLLLNGCATLGGKSNDDKIARLSGEAFVISVPKNTLDLNLVQGEKRNDASVLRLVNEQDYKLAFQSNGNRLTGPLAVEDPSVLILNSLNKYFKNRYQLKFVAKGTINNIEPDYIKRVLKKGDYVVDVRVTHLELVRDDARNLFYPAASFQFTVIDRAKGKHVLQDTCVFSEPNNAQSVQYFSNKNGAQISAFLKRFASPCLKYFAQGEPLEIAQSRTKQPSKTKPTATTKPASAVDEFARINLGSSFQYYPSYSGGARSLFTTEAGFTLGKPTSPTQSLVFSASAIALGDSDVPNFSDNTYYGASMSLGTNLYPSGNSLNGYSVLLRGQTAQSRQSGVLISTNAAGLGLGVQRKLFGQVQLQALYTYWQHIGPTKDTNLGGHSIGVGVNYQFN